MKFLVLVCVFLVLAGCATPSGTPTSGGGGVRGTVWYGATCPVQRDPPDPNCADRVYQTTLELTTAEGTLLRTFGSGADGVFQVEVGPGTYAIRSPPQPSLPRCSAGPFEVVAGNYTVADVHCDSGIR